MIFQHRLPLQEAKYSRRRGKARGISLEILKNTPHICERVQKSFIVRLKLVNVGPFTNSGDDGIRGKRGMGERCTGEERALDSV